MVRSVTNGTARRQISTRNMARKNFNALTIGGKTGSLDGQDPHGRYEWFMGFAQSKDDPSKAVIVVIMQVHDLQGYRSYDAAECPWCRAGQRLDALVNSFGYSKLV